MISLCVCHIPDLLAMAGAVDYLLNSSSSLRKEPRFSSGITLHSARVWITVGSFSVCQRLVWCSYMTHLWPNSGRLKIYRSSAVERLETDFLPDKREIYKQWFPHPLPVCFVVEWEPDVWMPAFLWLWDNRMEA